MHILVFDNIYLFPFIFEQRESYIIQRAKKKIKRKLLRTLCMFPLSCTLRSGFTMFELLNAIIRLIPTEKSTPMTPYNILSVISVGCIGTSANSMQMIAAIIVFFITSFYCIKHCTHTSNIRYWSYNVIL